MSDRFEEIQAILKGSEDLATDKSPAEAIASMRSAQVSPGRLTQFADQSKYDGRTLMESDLSLGTTFASTEDD